MEGCRCDDMKMISSRSANQGLGFIDPVTTSMATDSIIEWAKGLFSKPPDKIEYDRVRQQAWDSLVHITEIAQSYRDSGTLTRTVLQSLISTIDQLRAGFKAYTDKMLASGSDANWINPRFHDYYDWMGRVKSDMQTEMATLPADWGDYIPDIFGNDEPVVDLPDFPGGPTTTPRTTGGIVQQTGMNTTTMLIIGGVLVAMFLIPSKRSRGGTL